MAGRSEQLTLAMMRKLPAARPVAFRAFVDSDQLARWFGPRGFTIPSVVFAPRAGEPYRIEMQPPDGEPFSLTGEVQEVDPPSRLAYTFMWEQPNPDDVPTLVRLSFRDLGASTEVDLSQGPFTTEERRALHRDGWSDSLDKLERLLSAQD